MKTAKFLCLGLPQEQHFQVHKTNPLAGSDGYWLECEYYAEGVKTLMLLEGFDSVKDYFESYGYQGVQEIEG